MRFAIQLSKIEIGYCAEMNCLRKSVKKDTRQTPLPQHITLLSSVSSILYQRACDQRQYYNSLYAFNESSPGEEYGRTFLCVFIAYFFDKKKTEGKPLTQEAIALETVWNLYISFQST